MPRARVGVIFLVLVVGVLFSSLLAGAWVATSATAVSAQSLDLRVVDQRQIDLEGIRIFGLSPDGRWLAGMDGENGLCLYDVTSLATVSCVGRAQGINGPIDQDTVAWSPDGSRVAFTEDFRTSVECDVWMLEATTGILTNLTDDGATGALSRSGFNSPLAHVDVVPAWSPDSQALIFARSTFKQGEQWSAPGGTSLVRIDVKGENPPRS